MYLCIIVSGVLASIHGDFRMRVAVLCAAARIVLMHGLVPASVFRAEVRLALLEQFLVRETGDFGFAAAQHDL